MIRDKRITFLCSKDELQIIKKLAIRLQRTQSDAIRFLVLNSAQDLELIKSTATQETQLVQDEKE